MRVWIVLLLAVSAMLLLPGMAHASTKHERHVMVHRARHYLGVPYGYGPNAMTCTELTALSYKAAGTYLPYTVYEQKRAAWHTRRLRKGDLVFYDSYQNGLLDHVALYIGHGKVINANAYWGTVLKQPLSSIPGYRLHKRAT